MKNTSSNKPFLRWVGGKTRLLPSIMPLFPNGSRLIEPFVGAGSIFLASKYPKFLLADINPVLIALYRRIQSDTHSLIAELQPYFTETNCSLEAYNSLRQQYNDPATSISERTALFVYINRFGFNGLYRTNLRGLCNTPYGYPKRLPKIQEAAILNFAERLQQAELFCEDFSIIMDRATEGDVVYCDPPYADLNDKASFNAYDAASFNWNDQIRLANKGRELASRGVTVIISNHNTETTRSLYAGAVLHQMSVRRSIAADSEARVTARELVAVFSPTD